MSDQTLTAPAKLNLFLAITGRRSDGFHDLVSVVTPIALADTLTIAPAPAGAFSLQCNDADVPVDESNLILKAARLFVSATKWSGGATFRLEKQIPMGAGLGGGSSDGVAALRALNGLAGAPLGQRQLLELATALGSDCPLFLYDCPVVMRGRGERVEALPAPAIARLSGRRVLVFKPAFGIPTVWAYKRLAELAETQAAPYLDAAAAEQRLAGWLADATAPTEDLLFNSLERPAFEKYYAIPTLLEQLRQRGLATRMTGSGSACFALLPDGTDTAEIVTVIKRAWGDSAFVTDTRLA